MLGTTPLTVAAPPGGSTGHKLQAEAATLRSPRSGQPVAWGARRLARRQKQGEGGWRSGVGIKWDEKKKPSIAAILARVSVTGS